MEDFDIADRYYLKFAAAFVLGQDGAGGGNNFSEKGLEGLSEEELARIVHQGREAGLKIHKFKQSMDLPRVQKVLGILEGFQPQTLLDIGTGRGVFLWPLLDRFPSLKVTCLDILPHRIRDLEAVRRGGIEQISPLLRDIRDFERTPDAPAEFDFVTALEVLEHIPEVDRAVRSLVRFAKRGILVSVPSKEDENPEHIHLLTRERLSQLFESAGVRTLRFHHVLNHLILLALK